MKPQCPENDTLIDIIGNNGNTWEHYAKVNVLLDETIVMGINRALYAGFKRVANAKFIGFDGDFVEVVSNVEKTRGAKYVYCVMGAYRVRNYEYIPKRKIIN